MDELKWKRIMPEVSDEFHDRVEYSLAMVEQREERKTNMKIKHKVGFAAAAVLALGSITASAAGLIRWNSDVAKRFEADEVKQEQLIEQGVVEIYENSTEWDDDENISPISSEDSGMTVSLLQTVQDKRYLYIALEVDAPDGIEMDDRFIFDRWSIDADCEFGSSSAGWLDEEARIYEIWLQKDQNADLNGKTISISLTDLMGDEGKLEFYTALKGNWNLSWELNFEDTSIWYEINQPVTIEGYKMVVESIEISPISYELHYSGEEIADFWQKYSMDNDQYPLEADILMELDQVKYEDQSLSELLRGGGSAGYDEESGMWVISRTYERVIETEGIESFFVGSNENKVEIPLK